ncbi:MAG: SOS response-associated peptidase [Nanoarchaeota archaeon]|nr:SOS response-associated peptidase [Nanoarchaeota archaeon]
MCGRFSLFNIDSVAYRFGLEDMPKLRPNYNIAPSQTTAVILNESPKAVSMLRWGLIPSWAKDEKMGYKMINARAESVVEKPSYKGPFRHKRCLVIADGFYEWKKVGSKKVPFRVTLKQDLFAMAGIWDEWQDIRTFSIITCAPNKLLKPIHDRMPVILPKEKETNWLTDGPEDAKKLMKTYPEDGMKAFPISKLINSPENNGPEVIEQIKIEQQMTL